MAEPFSTSLGGMTTNVACAAAALGEPWPLHVDLIAPLGNDADSTVIEAELNHKGVNTDWLDRESRTHRCLILVEPDGSRSIISEPTRLNYSLVANRLRIGAGEATTKALYVDGFHALAMLDHVAEASRDGWYTAVDLDELPIESIPDIHDFFTDFDAAFINRRAAQQLFPHMSEFIWKEHLAEFAEATGTLILLTLGAEGAIVYEHIDRPMPVPSAKVKVKDTTGAGDVFAGVFLSSWLHMHGAVQSARYAAIAASLSTTEIGAQGCLPTHEQIARSF